MNRANIASPFQRLRRLLLHIESAVLILLLLAILAMAVIQIGLRNVFDTGIVWGDSLVRILVLWIAMAGAMVASRRGEHIRIDILTRYLPSRMQDFVNAGVSFLTAAVCGVTAVYSFKFIAGEYAFGGAAFAGVPVWLCALVIPVGFSVIAARYLLLGIDSLSPSNEAAP